MMTNRSNHMPTFTSREMTNMAGTLVRTLRNQNSWGTSTLHATIVQ
jgi:hypothetical protein